MRQSICFAIVVFLIVGSSRVIVGADFPAVEQLPSVRELPDPLVMLDGTRVTTAEQWSTRRKPELMALFQHYMYGNMPSAPKTTPTVRSVYRDCLGGKATMKQLTIPLGLPGGEAIDLLVVVPNNRKDGLAAPVVIGINHAGNHSVLGDPRIDLSKSRLATSPGWPDDHATEAGRGKAASLWEIEHAVERGYAITTFLNSDIGLGDGMAKDTVITHYYRNSGQLPRAADDWGAIAAWAWGMQRAVDYLVTDKDIDPKCIIAYGHSRNGKAALLTAAFDDRIAAVISHQSGCGGAAPNRRKNPKGESVKAITTGAPAWLSDTFKQFAGREDRLPFDQHCLIAMCAPRPVLLTNGTLDQWASPSDQFEALSAARPVYRLFGLEGLPENAKEPKPGERVGNELSCYLRTAPHIVDKAYWNVFLDFADDAFQK